jgi:integration host factor subunit alpha
MSLKKIDISRKISSKIDVSEALAKNIVSCFIKSIKTNSNIYDVKVANFGTFSNKVTPQRIGRNPKTGEEHIISERVKLNFTVSHKVKEQLN